MIIEAEKEILDWCQSKSYQAQDPKRTIVSVSLQRLEKTTAPVQAVPYWRWISLLLYLGL